MRIEQDPKEQTRVLKLALETALDDGDLFFHDDEEKDQEARDFIQGTIDQLDKLSKITQE